MASLADPPRCSSHRLLAVQAQDGVVSAAVTLALGFGSVLVAGLLLTSAIRNRGLGEVLHGVTSHNPETVAKTLGASGSTTANSKIFEGFRKGRTDQGVDFSSTPGTPIRTPYKSRILGILSNWYRGQPFVWYEILEGPLTGRYEYVAEQIKPTVKKGQVLEAGQQIGVYAPSGTGIERGFATSSGQTLAMATTGYREGQETAAGREYLELVVGEGSGYQNEASISGAIRKFFEGKGLSRAASSGIVGNLKQESGLNPAAAGGGIDQGQGSRALSGTLIQQLEQIWSELNGTEWETLGLLNLAKTPAEAAQIFSNRFERPSVPDLANRERYAQEAYAQ